MAPPSIDPVKLVTFDACHPFGADGTPVRARAEFLKNFMGVFRFFSGVVRNCNQGRITRAYHRSSPQPLYPSFGRRFLVSFEPPMVRSTSARPATFLSRCTPAPTADWLAAQSIRCMALTSVLGVTNLIGQTPP